MAYLGGTMQVISDIEKKKSRQVKSVHHGL